MAKKITYGATKYMLASPGHEDMNGQAVLSSCPGLTGKYCNVLQIIGQTFERNKKKKKNTHFLNVKSSIHPHFYYPAHVTFYL